MEFEKHPQGPDGLLAEVRALIAEQMAIHDKEGDSPFVAVGEIGLDYDRLHYAPKEVQQVHFRAQLDLAASLPNPPPLFLHSRACHEDFIAELRARAEKFPRRGVVHSFTGTVAEMRELVAEGWDIGVNGCSLRAEESIDVVREIPLERLQVETDGPWCEMRPTHASAHYIAKDFKHVKEQHAEEGVSEEEKRDEEVAMGILAREASFKWVKKEKFVEGALVKGRNEPCMIGRVVVAIARIKGVSVETVTEAAYNNTVKMFGLRNGKQ
jgi:TatD DNase family protein